MRVKDKSSSRKKEKSGEEVAEEKVVAKNIVKGTNEISLGLK